MDLPILVEPTAAGRFRAAVGEPFHLNAEGDSAGLAIQNLARLVEDRLRNGGAAVAALTVSNGVVRPKPAPIPADDAYVTDWVYRELTEAMAEERKVEESAGT